MKKLIFIGLLTIGLFGCDKTATDVSDTYSIPDELKDCTFTRLTRNMGNGITVVRCPNSVVSTDEKKGKSYVQTITVDGVEYVKK